LASGVVSQQLAAVLGQWLEQVVHEYPGETSRFLVEQSDPFANPVGATLHRELTAVVSGLFEGDEPGELAQRLHGVIRIRAVQDFRPAEALAFIPGLKAVLRRGVDSGHLNLDAEELASLERRVDQLLLESFDIYSSCRDQVHRIQTESIRNRSLKVMERLNEWRVRRDVKNAHAADDPTD